MHTCFMTSNWLDSSCVSKFFLLSFKKVDFKRLLTTVFLVPVTSCDLCPALRCSLSQRRPPSLFGVKLNLLKFDKILFGFFSVWGVQDPLGRILVGGITSRYDR